MLEAFRHFLLIVEHGTFTAAARRAHLSQPALTASIHRLEARFDAPLFVRGRTGAELTAAGRALLPHARAALVATEEAARAVAEVQGLGVGEIRIGGGAMVCTYLIPPVLASFRKKHPAIVLRVREMQNDDALDALGGGAIDLAIVMGDDGDLFRMDELILVAAPGLDTKNAPFITFQPGASSRALLDRVFPDANIGMELASISSVKGNVRAGSGVALISRSAVATDLQLGRLVEVMHPKTPVPRPLMLVHRGLDRLTPAAATLRSMLLEGAPKSPRKRKR